MSQPHTTPDLAVGVCTRDNIRTIERTVRSVLGLARRILVVDSGSTDGTIELCEALGAEVIRREWPGYARQKQFLLDECAEHRWVLLLDSDESLDEELRQSILRTVSEDDGACVAWELNRKVWFLGDWLDFTFQPEWRLRLVRGGLGRISGVNGVVEGRVAPLHESIEVSGSIGRLEGTLRHDSWEDLPDMFDRYVRYGQQRATYDTTGGKLVDVIVSPFWALVKQCVIKRGLLDGRRGLIAAGGAAAGTLIKHLFIAHQRLESERDET